MHTDERYRTIEQLHISLYDIQAEASALYGIDIRRSVKLPEEVLLVFHRYADTLIYDADDNGALADISRKNYLLVLTGIFDSIGEQIEKDVLQYLFVLHYLHVTAAGESDMLALFQHTIHILDHRAAKLAQIKCVLYDLHFALLELFDREKVIEYFREVLDR